MEATSLGFRKCQSKPFAGYETDSSGSILLENHSGEAKRLVNQHEYGKAMEKYLWLISHGNKKAMSEVASMLNNLNDSQILEQIFNLCVEASQEEQASPSTWSILGLMYQMGYGTERDSGKAHFFYEQAGNMGFMKGWVLSAKLYYAEKKYAEAYACATQAAEKGDTDVRIILSDISNKNIGGRLMNAHLFSCSINTEKSSLETTVEWHILPPPAALQRQIIKAHFSSFLDIYRDCTEDDLGLSPRLTKATWLTKMIEDELEEVNQGNMHLATISLDDHLAGFIICTPIKTRVYAPTRTTPDNLKIDIYISLLAVKPFRYFQSGNKIRMGLGQKLVQSLEARFTNSNTITLDTRLINRPAMLFYEKLGFTSMGKQTLGGSNPDYYVGYEKSLMRQI